MWANLRKVTGAGAIGIAIAVYVVASRTTPAGTYYFASCKDPIACKDVQFSGGFDNPWGVTTGSSECLPNTFCDYCNIAWTYQYKFCSFDDRDGAVCYTGTAREQCNGYCNETPESSTLCGVCMEKCTGGYPP